MIKKHIISILGHMFENNYHFGVLCRIDHVTFNPELSEEIKAEFRPLTLFYLAGYTFESARIEADHLSFEAGFGPDNIGSEVSVPLADIIQIIVDETPIFVNSTAKFTAAEAKAQLNIDQSTARESSFEALMSNPENQKLIKKRKK